MSKPIAIVRVRESEDYTENQIAELTYGIHEKLQEDYNKKVLENEALKAAKSAATKTRKTSDQFKAERKNIVSDLKEEISTTITNDYTDIDKRTLENLIKDAQAGVEI